jgi:hypothetical protein
MKARLIILALAAPAAGCQATPHLWEVGFNVSIESKIDDQTKVAAGFQVKRPAAAFSKTKPGP